MTTKLYLSGLALGCTLMAGISVSAGNAEAGDREKVLYSFCQQANCTDGANPHSPVLLDKSGNIYGTTGWGGTECATNSYNLCGTVFRLAPDGKETVIYDFCDSECTDGGGPNGLVFGRHGDLYGTTAVGGNFDCSEDVSNGCGTIFRVSADGSLTVLAEFDQGNAGGAVPYAGLAADGHGNFYGTTTGGGDWADCDDDVTFGCGSVFRTRADGTYTGLYSFTGWPDGEAPWAGVIVDKSGNIYGTTAQGGAGSAGTVSKISPHGKETILYSFTGGSDGYAPEGNLVMDKAGNLYGTTAYGGNGSFGDGWGTVFKVAPDGTETTLYIFSGGSDGGYPEAGLVMDKDGNLYGTTSEGGSGAHCGQEEYNCGTVFLLSSGGSLTTLHAFCSRNLCQDGASPVANLIADAKGNLYGTAWEGRVSGDGVVFEITR